MRHRLGDLDHLLLGDTEPSRRHPNIQCEPEFFEKCFRHTAGGTPVDQSGPAARETAEEYILRDSESRDEAELLMDSDNPLADCLPGGAETDTVPVNEYGPRCRFDGTSQKPDQRAFPRTVFSEERPDLPPLAPERDIPERDGPRVLLPECHGLERMKRGMHHLFNSFKRAANFLTPSGSARERSTPGSDCFGWTFSPFRTLSADSTARDPISNGCCPVTA